MNNRIIFDNYMTFQSFIPSDSTVCTYVNMYTHYILCGYGVKDGKPLGLHG